jgi:hypothetical protein
LTPAGGEYHALHSFWRGISNATESAQERRFEMADTNAEIAALKREIVELSGLSLATGVLLTQLLQKIVSREMSPQNAATQIVTNAREAIEGFASEVHVDPAMKQRALDAVKQYEDQIRSVLPI